MSHVRELRFESLEGRRLLSVARPVEVHGKHAVAATALVLSGTLTVDNHATTTSMDDEGDTTLSTPVSGQLGSLGAVHGVWTESSDQFGDYMGPDTLKIRDSQGTFTVSFNEQAGRRHRMTGGVVETSEPQQVAGGTGAYARVKESGTIELMTNSAHNAVETMTLTSQAK